MWTFDNFPAAKVKAAYGVDITPAWLDHVRAASVRLSVGCSGSVVSGQGLVLTNNHCVAGCAHDLSPPGRTTCSRPATWRRPRRGKDLPRPARRDPGRASPTSPPRMTAAGAGLTGEALVKARTAASGAIDKPRPARDDRKLRCEVVNLYHGGQFKLYRYRKYTDVRLVFSPAIAPPFSAATRTTSTSPATTWMRLPAPLRDRPPVATPDHLRWNPTPPTAGQPVFVVRQPRRHLPRTNCLAAGDPARPGRAARP